MGWRAALGMCGVAGSLLAAALLWGSPAQGQRPELVDIAIGRTLGFRTLHDGIGDDLVLQVDVQERIWTLDGKLGRAHWDGATLWWHGQRYWATPEPVALPAEWGERAGQVWDEWRAGFPNTTFFEEHPNVLDPRATYHPDWETWYRVDLPFAWDDGYAIYAVVTKGGNSGRVSVYDRETREPLEFGHYKTRGLGLFGITGADLDVPLSPDTYRPELPPHRVYPRNHSKTRGPHGEGYGSAWHEAQQQIPLMPGSQNGAAVSNAGPALGAVCTEAGTVHREHNLLTWTFPSSPERAELARLATVECPDSKLTLTAWAWHKPVAGQRSCVGGTLRVVNTLPEPDQVVWQRRIDECRNGPSEDQLEYPVTLPIPPGTDPSGVVVEFDAEVSLQCRQTSTDRGVVHLKVLQGEYPLLSWPGCYPGWEP
jgi:hypothetical protein